MSDTLLFRTIHGSHLYGLAGPDSDLDYYEVWADKRKNSQHISKIDGVMVDVTQIGLSEWLKQCDIGVPQALEAMFSEVADVDLIEPFRKAYRATGPEVTSRYLRTIKSFAYDGRYEKSNPAKHGKRRTHALRLAWSLYFIERNGRFRPEVSSNDQIMHALKRARESEDRYVSYLYFLTGGKLKLDREQMV